MRFTVLFGFMFLSWATNPELVLTFLVTNKIGTLILLILLLAWDLIESSLKTNRIGK